MTPRVVTCLDTTTEDDAMLTEAELQVD